jgi:hypothetical protein
MSLHGAIDALLAFVDAWGGPGQPFDKARFEILDCEVYREARNVGLQQEMPPRPEHGRRIGKTNLPGDDTMITEFEPGLGARLDDWKTGMRSLRALAPAPAPARESPVPGIAREQPERGDRRRIGMVRAGEADQEAGAPEADRQADSLTQEAKWVLAALLQLGATGNDRPRSRSEVLERAGLAGPAKNQERLFKDLKNRRLIMSVERGQAGGIYLTTLGVEVARVLEKARPAMNDVE